MKTILMVKDFIIKQLQRVKLFLIDKLPITDGEIQEIHSIMNLSVETRSNTQLRYFVNQSRLYPNWWCSYGWWNKGKAATQSEKNPIYAHYWNSKQSK